jgi:hypothetical protein
MARLVLRAGGDVSASSGETIADCGAPVTDWAGGSGIHLTGAAGTVANKALLRVHQRTSIGEALPGRICRDGEKHLSRKSPARMDGTLT